MLGSVKNQWRVAYAKGEGKYWPTRLTGSIEEGGGGMDPSELEGKYYRVVDEVIQLSDGRAMIKAVPVTADKEWVELTFKPEGGDGEFEWRSE